MINWLLNGIIALAIAGLYSIILVLLRTPIINNLITDQSIFKSALVIHVNLSVLVWLLSVTCAIWHTAQTKYELENLYSKISLLGMILMAISPLCSDSNPVMSNYIPMLENIIFIIGLCVFAAAILCFAIQTLIVSIINRKAADYGQRIITMVQFTSSVMFIGIWLCIYLSYKQLDELTQIVLLDIDYYYEMLFWSGGHLLQFIYTQIFMVVLLVLAEAWTKQTIKYANIYEMLFALNFILALTIFSGHFSFDIADGLFKTFFTKHMIYTSGIAPTIFILLLSFELIKNNNKADQNRFVPIAFVASLLLFLSGGAIGTTISGVNVTIPSHYHGSIVGISIAFMGFVHLICFKKDILLNLINNKAVINTLYTQINHSSNVTGGKYFNAHLYMITFGQLLHIIGLWLAGGYGVMRKTPGEDIPILAKFYMGMVGGGGLVAIIGGLMFVYICAKNLYFINKTTTNTRD